jgi:hypothetical protein
MTADGHGGTLVTQAPQVEQQPLLTHPHGRASVSGAWGRRRRSSLALEHMPIESMRLPLIPAQAGIRRESADVSV